MTLSVFKPCGIWLFIYLHLYHSEAKGHGMTTEALGPTGSNTLKPFVKSQNISVKPPDTHTHTYKVPPAASGQLHHALIKP